MSNRYKNKRNIDLETKDRRRIMRRIINKGCCIVFAFVLFVVFTSSQNGYVHAVNDAMQSGIMLDCARRYYSVEEIKKYIDILAEESNSFLQLHLSDNENVGVECRTLGQCADEDMYCGGGS